ncbi:TetR/AcrR family transcriptional regulator [Actinomadura algeriensis]|uniref:AcrR family transcriptional regulator n=1 Tax=Actinomadura algeriensis TaxID=1679523 RepID=A0ABR9K201_9ACTN|nr:TetR/AcrR family transcriptional regulator C-terminal domain-containing protein [Actinomadura algeriensis]MBE1536355.1 AcrR family transcriptional regulator [Actinomadura algeriensis]
MVVFAGQGDPRRSMDLLWRAAREAGARGAPGGGHGRPGPRPGLSVELIVDTAIAVADAEGMAALSMRAVGERLGRTAMALYTYVPGKAELVDLMYDRAQAELPSGYGGGWRAAVTAWAHDTWAFYLRHPWMLAVSQARPVLGPGEYRALEALLEALSGAGLRPGDARRAVATLSSVVRGAARTAAEARQAARATGASEDEWWHARSGALQDAAPDFAERFPRVAALSAAGAFDDEAFEQDAPAEGPGGGSGGDFVLYQERAAREAFTGGLALVLDGIEAAAARSAP